MRTIYNPDLKAHLSFDEKDKIRHVRHSQEYWLSEQNIPRLAANHYLNEMAETLQIPQEQLKNLHIKVSFLEPREQGIEYHLSEEKHLFDSTTIGFYQTYMNVPVWRKGLSVKVKQNPNRVVGSVNNSEDGIKGTLPNARVIEQYKTIFQQAAAEQAVAKSGVQERGEAETASFVRRVLKVSAPRGAARRRTDDGARLLSGKFFIYKYDPKRRYAGKPSPPEEKNTGKFQRKSEKFRFPNSLRSRTR